LQLLLQENVATSNRLSEFTGHLQGWVEDGGVAQEEVDSAFCCLAFGISAGSSEAGGVEKEKEALEAS
jgi:hypothetical protein